jgi:hypothetical protein
MMAGPAMSLFFLIPKLEATKTSGEAQLSGTPISERYRAKKSGEDSQYGVKLSQKKFPLKRGRAGSSVLSRIRNWRCAFQRSKNLGT